MEASHAITLIMEPPPSGTGPIRGVYPSTDVAGQPEHEQARLPV
jgi:hypothetical protein